MKQINQFLFNFNIAYFYTFIAGILVSLTANIFTTALLTERLPVRAYNIQLMALSLFISSLGAFRVSTILESARREWESEGSPKDPVVIRQDYIEKGKRKRLLWFYFAIIFFGPILLIIYFYSVT